jgi:bifunctional DNase/RNase
MNRPKVRCERCSKPPVIHITTVDSSRSLTEAHLCENCAARFLGKSAPTLGSSSPTTDLTYSYVEGSVEVEVELQRIIISEIHEQQVMQFREAAGLRRFWITIGIFEATTLDRTLKELPSPRPLAHDAWLNTIVALGAVVQAVCICELRDYIYSTDLRLIRGGEIVVVDMRPSDAVILALKAQAPIVIPDRLFSLVASQA